MLNLIIKNTTFDSVIIGKENILHLNFWNTELKCETKELYAAIHLSDIIFGYKKLLSYC